MKIVPSNDVRRDFTDIANKVKYTKESYIVTNQNKPSVGIVPIEFLQLLPIIKEMATRDKKFAKAFKAYITFINEEDLEFLDKLANAPKKMNPHLKKAADSLKGKVKDY